MYHLTQVGSKLSAQSTVNLLGTTLVLKVASKTKQPPPSHLLCIQLQRQSRTLTLSLHRSRRRPRHQLCAPTTDFPSCSRRRTGAMKSTTLRTGAMKSTTLRVGHPWWTSTPTPLRTPAVSARQHNPAPPAEPLNLQGTRASQLHSGHEEEKAELL